MGNATKKELLNQLVASEAWVQELKKEIKSLKLELGVAREAHLSTMKQLKESKAETKSWKNAAKQGYTII